MEGRPGHAGRAFQTLGTHPQAPSLEKRGVHPEGLTLKGIKGVSCKWSLAHSGAVAHPRITQPTVADNPP